MAYTADQLMALQNQLNQARQQAMLPFNDTSRASTASMGTNLGQGGVSATQHQAALQNMQRLQGLVGGAGGGGAAGTGDPMADSLNRIRALTEGRSTELANDPYQKSVMDFLQGVTNGQNVPYTNEVQSAMLAQQGRGTADAEAAQMAALREGMAASGGSIYDPAYQSAAREAMSQRQGRNLDAAGQMASRAGLANFDARMSGAGQLAAARGAQNAQINQMNLAGAGYRARESRETPGGAGFNSQPYVNPFGDRTRTPVQWPQYPVTQAQYYTPPTTTAPQTAAPQQPTAPSTITPQQLQSGLSGGWNALKAIGGSLLPLMPYTTAAVPKPSTGTAYTNTDTRFGPVADRYGTFY